VLCLYIVCSGAGALRCRAELDGVPEITVVLTCEKWSSLDDDDDNDDDSVDVGDAINHRLPPTHCLATHVCVSGVFPGNNRRNSIFENFVCDLLFFFLRKKEPPLSVLRPCNIEQLKTLAENDLKLINGEPITENNNNKSDNTNNNNNNYNNNAATHELQCKLVFTPPLGQFELATYRFRRAAAAAPLIGAYTMRESTPGSVRVVLKVDCAREKRERERERVRVSERERERERTRERDA
jgi:hypothetical protein